MKSGGFSSKKASVPPRWKMALLTWIAVWLDQHLCVALFNADASAHGSACTCCRASCCRHGRDPVLGRHAFVDKACAPVALHRKKGHKKSELRQEEEILFLPT